MLKLADLAPGAVGLKITVTVQLAPPPRPVLALQVVVLLKSDALVPLMVSPVKLSNCVAVLVSVMV